MSSTDSIVNLNKSGKRKLDPIKARPLTDSVLRLIWMEHKISRADIARRFDLSRSTVTEIVKELLQTGFVSEVGLGQSSGGRRPMVLEFQDDAKAVLGVDIGASHVSVALTNLRGKLLAWKEENHPVREDPSGTRALVIKLCDDCLASVKFNCEKLVSIGVAFPSPVDPIHPEILSEEIIPAWQGQSGFEQLQQRYGVPVYLDNDANLGALAEQWWGAGRGVDDLIYIKIAYGIGAGYILGGEIYRGSKGISGELGHLPIDPNGKYCGCGQRGCLATLIAGWALEERAYSLLSVYPESRLAMERLTIRDIEDAALAGDPLALHVVREAANYLSIAVMGLINLMNPNMVVFGGSLAILGDLILDPIREKVQHCNLMASITPPQIQSGELGSQTVAIGAATLALKEIYNKHHFYQQDSHAGVV